MAKRVGGFLVFVLLLIGSGFSQSNWVAVRGTASPDRAVTHDGKASMRLEPKGTGDAMLRSSPVKLAVGKRYEIRGWLRTDALEVQDIDRTPVATGVSLSMASIPWDVHSESIAGTTEWKRVSLDFTATRAEDRMEVRVAEGGSFRGKAWMEGVTLQEIPDPSPWPNKAAVKTFGPAYRYPEGGWIYLHIEGEPYERGFQHGTLLAQEIPTYIDRCAAELNPKDRAQGWSVARTVANALFLRGYDEEILTEMKGIADGAAAAGAKYGDRKIDLVDIVAGNSIIELAVLASAVDMMPTGLERLRLQPPSYGPRSVAPPTDRCSAFAATGKASRDGHMVIGHTTWTGLTSAEQVNVMLDVKPARGRRVVMQSYPGGVQSGTDWFQNDAGVVLTETTIDQSPFNVHGTPESFRARKAIQYGTNIDEVVRYLAENDNGLYSNEWLIADAKTDEIAMFELGTYKSKLWRSSKNEWFDGTDGFYWGCNNTKDLNVRLEYVPDPKGKPIHLPYMDGSRDRKWVELFNQFKGQIDEQFGFLAFRTAPLVSYSAMDSKITTAEMAPKMMLWAVFGRPNEREWAAASWDKEQFPDDEGLYSSGYRLFEAAPDARLAAFVRENEEARVKTPSSTKEEQKTEAKLKKVDDEKLWKGWMLPATPDDDWLILGSSYYYEVLSAQNPEDELNAWRLHIRDSGNNARKGRAVLVFDALRRQIGDEKFLDLMRRFYEANTTKTVRGADFLAAAGLKSLPAVEEPSTGSAMLLSSLYLHLGNALIVYGTESEAGTNRYAAEALQARMNDSFESRIPIRKDFELLAGEAKTRTLIFVGRPETNSALRAYAGRLELKFDGASFEMGGKTYAHERDGLACAQVHPDNAKEMIIVLAGNSPVETARLAQVSLNSKSWQVTHAGKSVASGY